MADFFEQRDQAIKTRKDRTTIDLVPLGRDIIIKAVGKVSPLEVRSMDSLKNANKNGTIVKEHFVVAVGENVTELKVGDQLQMWDDRQCFPVTVKDNARDPQKVVDFIKELKGEEEKKFFADNEKIEIHEYKRGAVDLIEMAVIL